MTEEKALMGQVRMVTTVLAVVVRVRPVGAIMQLLMEMQMLAVMEVIMMVYVALQMQNQTELKVPKVLTMVLINSVLAEVMILGTDAQLQTLTIQVIALVINVR